MNATSYKTELVMTGLVSK